MYGKGKGVQGVSPQKVQWLAPVGDVPLLRRSSARRNLKALLACRQAVAHAQVRLVDSLRLPR
jgi:hypothetical protein